MISNPQRFVRVSDWYATVGNKMSSWKQYSPILLNTCHQYKYLASIGLMALFLTYATVRQACVVHALESPYSFKIQGYPGVTFLFLIPLFFSLGLCWKYLSFGTGYKVIGDNVNITNEKQLRNLLRCFIIHNSRLCHRSRLGIFFSLVILVNAYVLPILAGINLNITRDYDMKRNEWELFEDILNMLANTSVLVFTIVQVLFGFDIELLAVGGRYIISEEEDKLEKVLKKPVRDALLRYPIQVDIVSRKGSSYALVSQTTDGISFGGVPICSFRGERPRDQLKRVHHGVWKVPHLGPYADSMNVIGLTNECGVVI